MKSKFPLAALLLSLVATGDYAHAIPFVPVSEVPDVVLERLDEEGRNAESVGADIVNDGGRQTLSSVLAPGQAQNYLIHIKNQGEKATAFRVSLGGLLSAAGTETRWQAKGWEARATLDGDGNNIFPALTSEKGWESPLTTPGGEVAIRLSLNSPATLALPMAVGSFRVVARKGDLSDAVIGRVGPQFISKIQWTLDGDDKHPNRWHDVTEKTSVLITRHATLGVRAEKAVPAAPWGDNKVLGPTWSFQGRSVEGGEVWLQPQDVALMGATVTATLGNSKSFQARVLPDAYVSLNVDSGFAIFTTHATRTQPVVVSVKVEDEDDAPLPNVKVRLRTFKGKTAISSFWTPLGSDKVTESAEPIFLTDEKGEVKMQWSVEAGAAPVGTKVEIKAEVIDEEGRPFGDDDTFNVDIEAGDR